ncbi:MAG: helix-turn-helix domain-containing protein [Clostridiales bacterium]|nr:helix-turn-helix domain-containing protein [Clostridiales bacterium]
MDLIQIGNKIRQLRKACTLTQEELAETMGVSPQAVSKWENGHCLPETAVLPKLARTLNCSIEDMLLMDVECSTSKMKHQKTLIIEPKIIRKGELIIAGIKGDGNQTGLLWKRYDTLGKTTPLNNKKEEGGYELRIYDRDDSCECWVGESVLSKVNDNNYQSIMLPDVWYAVFEIYPARGYDSQNEAMDKWLLDNNDQYEQLKMDNKHYVIEFYDERFKGNEDPNSIVEMWIPIIKRI